MTIQVKKSFLNTLGKKMPKFAKTAAVAGSAFLTVLTADAHPEKQTDSKTDQGKAPAVKREEYSLQDRLMRDFARGMADGFAIGAANPLVDATLGGPSKFAVVLPDASKTSETNKTMVVEKQTTPPVGTKKIATRTTKVSGDTKARKHE